MENNILKSIFVILVFKFHKSRRIDIYSEKQETILPSVVVACILKSLSPIPETKICCKKLMCNIYANESYAPIFISCILNG